MPPELSIYHYTLVSFRLLGVGEPGFVAKATIPNLRLDQAETNYAYNGIYLIPKALVLSALRAKQRPRLLVCRELSINELMEQFMGGTLKFIKTITTTTKGCGWVVMLFVRDYDLVPGQQLQDLGGKCG